MITNELARAIFDCVLRIEARQEADTRLKEENAALRAKIARYEAPVSDEEVRRYSHTWARSEMMAFLAARANPPASDAHQFWCSKGVGPVSECSVCGPASDAQGAKDETGQSSPPSQ